MSVATLPVLYARIIMRLVMNRMHARAGLRSCVLLFSGGKRVLRDACL
jgi:hypothetical protein